ncbi:MAG TPA: ABC transporter ATP-binding protein [Candidatus Acidoferrales bacterium]|nr:ABC transporter ATP-binding protein [Candidatus Acidoferrales bacterium]HTX57220.1 ABC transporter ATP-binding protein [Candidatus Acidoferrales bacterium]
MFAGHGLMWSNVWSQDKPKMKRPVDWRRIGALFKPYWKEQAVVLLCIVISSVLALVPIYASANLIDKAIPQRNFHLLLFYVGISVGAALIAMSLGVVQGYLNSVVGEAIMRDIRVDLVGHLHKMPLAFYTGTRTGEIMNRVSSDVDNIDGVVTGTITTIVTNVVIIISTVIAMFAWNWKLALVSLVVAPLMIVQLGPVGRRMFALRRETRVQRDNIESITQETLSISGITLIKSFAREKFERSRFREAGTDLMHLEVRMATVGRWFLGSIQAMSNIGPAIIWLVGGWFALQGQLDTGVIVAFIGFVGGRLYGAGSALTGIQVQIVSALAVFERIFDYLDMKTEDYDPPGAVALTDMAGNVRFERVTFGYDPDRVVLHDLSFDVAPGQIAAFVGPSGAGKSTITQLVPRFYDPQAGTVLIDERDVRTLTLESLRSGIGIVTQETYLFHDTIASNLRYAKPEASDDELVAAARAANIHDFITTLPKGYETVVGERGHKLSGGERQRLAIARVLLKNPCILILDEATSALDSHNEAAIQEALDIVMRGRTSLVIAHRLSTIVNADVIFVIEGGRIVEHGSHAVLLARNGPYARLYRTQFRDTAIAT